MSGPSHGPSGPLPDHLVALVHSEARRAVAHLTTIAFSYEDFVGYGMVGLLEATPRWQPASGVPFEHFVRFRIRGAMVDALRSLAPSRRRSLSALREYAVAHAATPEPTATSANEAADVAQIITHIAVGLLVDAAELDDSGEAPDPEHLYVDAETRAHVDAALSTLSVEDREVLDSIYGFGDEDSGSDLARRRGVSRSTISRAHLRILDLVRARLRL